MNKRKKGEKWERYALIFLEKKGYKKLYLNWTCRWGEIDIIALDTSTSPKELVFVEVKFRAGDSFGHPYEAITFYKLKAQKRAINYFLAKNNLWNRRMRFDVVGISEQNSKQNRKLTIKHFKAVPLQ